MDSRTAQQLLARIEEAVRAERYEVSIHADNRIEERGMMEWHIVAGLPDADLLEAQLDDHPWPSVLLSQALPDGTEVYVKWSYRARDRMARLVTIYYPD
ncbi:MAG: DUF4258 domain-containing protein [Planctomycetes bacterium]|nr:DUF4258 domain-containing protein [Planctomycetota bacterium]